MIVNRVKTCTLLCIFSGIN